METNDPSWAWLPFVEQHFFVSIHLQDTFASGAPLFQVHKAVYLLDVCTELSVEQLATIDHEMKVEMNKDITAKLERARADLRAAERRFAIELAECCLNKEANPSAKLKALIAEVKLLQAAAEMANSRSRGGKLGGTRGCEPPPPSPHASPCPAPPSRSSAPDAQLRGRYAPNA